MPSTTSSSVARLLASSTVITPSLPTFCIASASILPTSASPFAEIVPTWAISSFVATLRERLFRSLTTASTARSTPRFRSIGFMPAATDFAPSRTIAAARMVAVVVPSPATSLVLLATSRTICAPMFSNLSESSISLATVTPSLVIRGAPKLFSSTTLRPFGPSVTLTASASVVTPLSILVRASVENFTSLAAIGAVSLVVLLSGGPRVGGARVEHAHDVAFLHDQQLVAVELDLGAGPLAEQHPVADLDAHRRQVALVAAGAGSDGQDLALHGLLLGGVGDDQPTLGLRLLLDAPDDDAVVQRPELHLALPWPGFPGRLLALSLRERQISREHVGASWSGCKGSAAMRTVKLVL